MKRSIFTLLGFSCLIPFSLAASEKVSIEGAPLRVIEVQPEASTGLSAIFVVSDVTNTAIKFRTDDRYAKVFMYDNLGGAYGAEISNTSYNAGELTIPNPIGNRGYIVEENGRQYAFWIVDYKDYYFDISSVSVSPQSDCSYTILDVVASANPIQYFTINGQQKTLSREIEIDFTTSEYDESGDIFQNIDKLYFVQSITGSIRMSPAVLSSTYFTVSGDRFLKEWGISKSAQSSVYDPVAVAVHTSANQERNSATDSNEIHGDDSVLGGSAPADIYFKAVVSQAVIHNEWQLSRDPSFENPEYRFTSQDLDYTFQQEGTYYVKYIGSNSDGSCEAESDIYTVMIGASELLCPNAFSPNDDGINDIWKVSYRSLIEFNCWIFDRNGQQLYSFNSPDGGWDGKVGGKTVKPGVYYYVIQAVGADGKKYKKSGDINIIRSNSSTKTYDN